MNRSSEADLGTFKPGSCHQDIRRGEKLESSPTKIVMQCKRPLFCIWKSTIFILLPRHLAEQERGEGGGRGHDEGGEVRGHPGQLRRRHGHHGARPARRGAEAEAGAAEVEGHQKAMF